MGYYLSNQKRSLVDLLVPYLKEKKDLTLKVGDAKRFEDAIRSACHKEEYKWIKDKFIVSAKDDKIIFKLRDLQFEVVEEPETVVEDEVDMFEIINHLLLYNQNNILFQNPKLNEQEVSSIKAWCTTNKYDLTLEDQTLRVKKK